jgi:small subunit ribosomal protein S1
LEDELKARRRDLLESLQVGQILEGTVKNITDFGAFVDLGGVDGLLHKVDMSWGRINHPSEVISAGDKTQVVVLDVKPEEERISLGLKQKTPDPWSTVEEKYPVDSLVTGKVTNVVDYGAFVELEEGVEGLVHVTEMSWSRRLVHPSKIMNKGDIIEARVLDIDTDRKKISLGLKQLQPNPWELLETKYPVGSRIHGKVRNLTDFGAFVEIEKGIDGLIHVSDMSWAKRFVNPREILQEGDEVEVIVLSIDTENQRVSLGLKQIEPDPWLKVSEKYKVGSTVRGEVVNLTDFGAFVRLEEGVEGLIHISELDDRHVETPDEIVSEGDVLNLKVISIDGIERRIGLSLRSYKQEQERTSIRRYLKEQEGEGPTLGALIREAREEYRNKN